MTFDYATSVRRLGDVIVELQRLGQFEKLSGAQERQQTALLDEGERLNKQVAEFERSEDLAKVRAAANGAPGYTTESGAPSGHDDRGHEPARSGIYGQARRAIDGAARSGGLPDHAAEVATRLVESGSARDRGVAAEWAVRAGDADYAAAFTKVLSDPERGHLLWTELERQAFARVQEFRAASLSDAGGGYMVPLTLDPAIMLTSDGTASALRQAARNVTTTTNQWNGVTAAGVTTHWRAEAGETDDDAPALGEVSIPVHRADSFIPFSFEIGMDAPNFLAEMQRLMVDSSIHHEAVALTTGSGTGMPTGVVTALTGGPSVVTGTGTEALASADVYALQAALPPRFSANARFMAALPVINTIAQFESTNGARLFPEIGSGSLLRKQLDELSTMDAVINPAATEANHVLIYGDFTAGMVIVDRIGTTIELVPHLVGSNRRPTGQRGLLMWRRVGADVVVPEAFRILNVATTA